MSYVALMALCILFVEAFIRLGLHKEAGAVLSGSRDGLGILTAAELGDDDKERLVRRASLEILRTTGLLALKLALLASLLYAAYRGFVAAFPSIEAPMAQSLVSLPGLVALTAASAGYAWLRHVARQQL